MSAFSSPRALESMMACRLVPDPDISTPSFTGGRASVSSGFIRDQRELAARTASFDYSAGLAALEFANYKRHLTLAPEPLEERLGLLLYDHCNHSDTVVEGVIHFGSRNSAGLRN